MKLQEIKPEIEVERNKTNVLIPKIYVLCGIPGSGKSTWVKSKVASSPEPYTVVSSDAVIEAKAAAEGLTYTQGYEKFIGAATGACKQNFRTAANNRENIIYDQTNISVNKRKGILSQLPSGYHKVAVVFDVPDAVLKKRLEDREKATGKHIPEFVLKDMFSRWQAPSKVEGFDEIIKV